MTNDEIKKNLPKINELSTTERVALFEQLDKLSKVDKDLIIKEYSSLIKDKFEKEKDVANRFYDVIENAQSNLSIGLKREDCTSEERNHIYEKDMEYAKMAFDKQTEIMDSNNRMMVLVVYFFSGLALGAVILTSNGKIVNGVKNAIKFIAK